MNVLQSALLGLIQGLGEFLPISSSGHLLLCRFLLGIQGESASLKVLDILLHVGTLLPLLMIFWKDWWDMLRHPVRNKTFILLIIFSYKPMYGVVIAFKDYKNSLGIMGSPWADPLFKHFNRFFSSFQCGTTIRNTLALSLYSLLVGFPIPIILALMINQISAKRFRKGFQTILYLPHFISTVVMVGLLLIWLSPSRGLLGAIYGLFGKTAPNIMGEASAFRSIYVWSDIWQHAGWDSHHEIGYEVAVVSDLGQYIADFSLVLNDGCHWRTQVCDEGNHCKERNHYDDGSPLFCFLFH